MKTVALLLAATMSGWLLCPHTIAAQTSEAKETAPAGISKDELTAEVPALDNLHEVIHPLWHEAYPAKNYQMIRELLPQADERTAALDAAVLPGILRDKQAAWDTGKVKLKDALLALHKAADTNDEPAMLKQTEAYHAAFEGLVRTIRPPLPELDAFHQELYKLYHYYAPAYDLAAIRSAAAAMKEKLPPLAAAKLPARVAGRQPAFDAAVKTLSSRVDELIQTAEKDSKDAVLAAVETVHTAYLQTAKVFD